MNRIAQILNSTKNERRGGTPHDSWVSRERDILMMQVRNTMDLETKPGVGDAVRHLFGIFMPVESLAFAGRVVGMLLLVFTTMAGGGVASAHLYRSAEPGTAGYAFKMAVENLQMAFAPNAEYRARLFADFADRRADEIASLAEAGSVRQSHAPEVVASFRHDVEGLRAALATLEGSHDAASLESAKLMERKMAGYQSVLSKAAARLAPVGHAEFAAARDLVDDLSVKAMAVIVEKHIQGDTEASRGVVVAKFSDRLNDAEAKADLAASGTDATVTARAREAKTAIAEAKKLVSQENYQAALTKMAEVVELTKDVDPVTDATTDQTTPATTDTKPQTP